MFIFRGFWLEIFLLVCSSVGTMDLIIVVLILCVEKHVVRNVILCLWRHCTFLHMVLQYTCLCFDPST